MVVAIYPICERRNIWSFRPQPGAKPVKVRAPRGSSLLEVKGLGLELFVPAAADPLQRHAFHANQVMRAARQGGRFKLVGANKAECAVGGSI